MARILPHLNLLCLVSAGLTSCLETRATDADSTTYESCSYRIVVGRVRPVACKGSAHRVDSKYLIVMG